MDNIRDFIQSIGGKIILVTVFVATILILFFTIIDINTEKTYYDEEIADTETDSGIVFVNSNILVRAFNATSVIPMLDNIEYFILTSLANQEKPCSNTCEAFFADFNNIDTLDGIKTLGMSVNIRDNKYSLYMAGDINTEAGYAYSQDYLIAYISGDATGDAALYSIVFSDINISQQTIVPWSSALNINSYSTKVTTQYIDRE